MNKKPVSIPEAFEILSSADLPDERQKEILAYTERFHHVPLKDAKKAVKDLKKISDLQDYICTKLVDLAPRSSEELTSILSSFNVTVPEEKLNSILDYFSGLLE